MALDPLELGTIAAIIIVFFLWGPQKIPELARMIGVARKEFENATKEVQNIASSIQNEANPLFAPSKQTTQAAPSLAVQPARQGGAGRSGNGNARPALPPPTATGPGYSKTGDQLLIEAARKLGISTQGKTREQIQGDIISMAQRPQATPVSATPATASGETNQDAQPSTNPDPPA